MITNLLQSDLSEPPKDDDPDNKDKNSATTESNSLDNTTTKIAPNSAASSSKTKGNFLRYNIFKSWKQISLRRRATILGLAIGVIPIAAIGGIAHHLAAESLMQQIINDQESRTFDIRQKVSIYVNNIISDATTIASSPLFTDPELSKRASVKQKVAMLDSFLDAHHSQGFDSIAVFDVQGKLLFQSKSPHPISPNDNYSNREYFQRAITNKTTAINDPEIHSLSGKNKLEVAVPIKEKWTGKMIGIVCLRMPLSHWRSIFQYVQSEGWEYRLIDTEGYIFDTEESEYIGRRTGADIKDLPQLQARLQTQMTNSIHGKALTKVMRDTDDDEKVLVTLASIPNIEGVLDPGWQLALSRPVEDAFASLQELRLTLLIGASLTALIVGASTAFLAKQVTMPILAAAGAIRKIGRGELNTQLQIDGQDELSILGSNINKMAKQMKALVNYKAAEAQRSQRLKDLTLQLSRTLNSDEVFQIAVEEILEALQADRVLFYGIEENGHGKVIAESTTDSWSSLRKVEANQLEYLKEYVTDDHYQFGKVRAIPNIYQANLGINHLKQLEAFAVKAELVAPFSVGQKFRGLLIVHQCKQPRKWQQAEINFFAQLTSQIVLALERINLIQDQKSTQEQLQKRALELLVEVEPISRGDLTTHATVTEDEIGTLADSYNSTVESLRQIVVQVQKSITRMATATGNNEGFAQSLSERASQQSEAIGEALNQIQAMAESIHTIATNAEQAETTFQEVLKTVATGDVAMDRTVEGILAIRETVAETAKKVKRLGESSQKISKVVNLISSFAAQTNLLALNASLEATRAGEEGHNFARVAEEIRDLAQQSAEATTEIEKIVASIQLDTKEVVTAMEEGTERVVIGTKLVDETRQSLSQVANSSKQVSNRIAKIAQETVEEFQASKEITQTIAEVAEMASTTSKDAAQVSASTKELLTVAQELQESISQFKV
ncbi:MAG: methyl-accepting chemotaxis protein [Xenococcaceae cyanobacterium MO_207.B15]|nr:methyl-accepting chemotaxis protein [Xenococcaceae cyanobacterium MO_207.B15]MDJ0743822.1 methyl-accepting chemotaxis protein [Xenococcaceae cyanobacterium MO_167.B27]